MVISMRSFFTCYPVPSAFFLYILKDKMTDFFVKYSSIRNNFINSFLLEFNYYSSLFLFNDMTIK